MIVLIDKSFEKDVQIINDKKLLYSIADCIEDIQNLKKISEIPNCKKLKGGKKYYSIRIRQYRIGFVYENHKIEFVRFLHRSKIYEHFPD